MKRLCCTIGVHLNVFCFGSCSWQLLHINNIKSEWSFVYFPSELFKLQNNLHLFPSIISFERVIASFAVSSGFSAKM